MSNSNGHLPALPVESAHLPVLFEDVPAESAFILGLMYTHTAGVHAGYAPHLTERARREGVLAVLGTPIYVQLRDEMIDQGMPKGLLRRWPMRSWQ